MNTDLLDCGHPHDAGESANVGGKTIQGWTSVLDFDGKRRICRACADARTLDCGHTPSAHSAMTTGYATDGAGKTLCYACCAERDKADMVATGRATLYLVRKKSADGKEFNIFTRHVTNWPGSLEFLCTETRHYPRAGGFGSQRTDAWFVGPDGYVWHAVNRGDSGIARCKRTKEKAK